MKFPVAVKVIGSPIPGHWQKYFDTVSDEYGNIIGIPFDSRHFIKLNVKEQRWTQIGSDLGDGRCKYSGGIIAKDGVLYCTPYHANRIAKLNIESQQISFVGDSYDGYNKWESCVMGNDDNIYFIPFKHSHIMKLDVKSGETSLIGDGFGSGDDFGYGHDKWSGGAVGSDGCLYFVPHKAKRVLRVDVVNGTTTMIGDSYDVSMKWNGCIADRKSNVLYCCPYNANQILMINIVDQTTSLIGEDLGTYGFKWSGFVKDHDNRIYGIPCKSNHILFFDPKTHETSLIEDDLGNKWDKWTGAALNEDGSIYAIPSNAEKILKITPFLTRWKTTVLNDIAECNTKNAAFINIVALRGGIEYADNTEWSCLEESINYQMENTDHSLVASRVHIGIVNFQRLQRCINRMDDDEYLIIAMYPTHYVNEINELIAGNDHILWARKEIFTEDYEEHRSKRLRSSDSRD